MVRGGWQPVNSFRVGSGISAWLSTAKSCEEAVDGFNQASEAWIISHPRTICRLLAIKSGKIRLP